jgi:hypothetical protein
MTKDNVQEPVVFKIYKPTPPRGSIPDVRDAELPWVYDQDPSSGNVASMWVTPVKATPPAAQRQHVTDGNPCWCEPETSYTAPGTGVSVIVHREPQ